MHIYVIQFLILGHLIDLLTFKRKGNFVNILKLRSFIEKSFEKDYLPKYFFSSLFQYDKMIFFHLFIYFLEESGK